MLVDPEGNFLSQRNKPEMATFSVALADRGLIVGREGFGSIHVPLLPVGLAADVTVWRSVVRAQQVSGDVDEWFSEVLSEPTSLVVMTASSNRPVNPDFGRPSDQVSFADGYPLLLTNTASHDDLNTRLEAPVPMNRFRPSVVIQGPPAWAEDGWSRVCIGNATFRVAKPCGRCLVTTTDQETGRRGAEPLRTLATFRQVGQSVNFGGYLIPDSLGEIRVGDEVMAAYARAAPR